jgi:hypothetical protein
MRHLIIICFWVCLAAAVSAEDANPRSAAKVGDWAEYSLVDSRKELAPAPEFRTEKRWIKTVTKVAEDEIFIEERIKERAFWRGDDGKMTSKDMEDIVRNSTLKKKGPLDVAKEKFPDWDDDAKLKRLADSVETIELKGKTIKIRLVTFEVQYRTRKTSWKVWLDMEGGAFPEVRTFADAGESIGTTATELIARGTKDLKTDQK